MEAMANLKALARGVAVMAALGGAFGADGVAGAPATAGGNPPAPAFPGVVVEAESFADRGGWAVDQQFMGQMGSAFLLAHGIGRPVKDAVTRIALPPGRMRLWVRTRDWAPPQGPGKFEVFANGRSLGAFGVGGSGRWEWWQGGEFASPGGAVELRLHDLAGFEGRVDALAFLPPKARPPAAFSREWRAALLGFPPRPPVAARHDFIVVGGGFAGMCAAVAAARAGVRTALVQDRPTFGGNGSSEVRIPPLGRLDGGPFPRNADLMRELAALVPKHQGEACGDRYLPSDEAFEGWLRAETNLTLYAFCRCVAARCQPSGHVAAITVRRVLTGEDFILEGLLFADCTGDATLAEAAGAETRWDAEDRERTGEELAPPKGARRRAGGLGSTNQWFARDTDGAKPFPECPWALRIENDSDALVGAEVGKDWIHSGGWNWETGYYRDPAIEGEAIRDHNFRAIYGLWDYLKHRSPHRDKYANAEIYWMGHLLGKRDAHRVVGDYVLTAHDIASGRRFADGAVNATWYLDLHFPHPSIERRFPDRSFRAYAYDDWGWKELRRREWVGWSTPVRNADIPFRCLYARDVDNLLLAGKTISGTYAALSSYRVENTTGMMGAAIGRAAAACVRLGCRPRELCRDHFAALAQALGGRAEEPAPASTNLPFMIQRYRDGQNFEPGVWEATVAELAKHPGAADEVWFSTGVGIPPLKWHEEQAARMIAAAADLRQLGIAPSLEYQATIGHGDPVARTRKADVSAKTWRGWTLENGAETKSCSCPRQPAFRDYVRKMSEIYARVKPVWLWLDDDFRPGWHTTWPVQESGPGCFCETCLADFAAFDGNPRTRAELVAALKNDSVLADRWGAFTYGSLAEVAKIIAETVHAISPETRFGFQHGGGIRDYQRKIFDALYEAGGRKPVGSRPGGGAYTDHAPFGLVDKMLEMGLQMSRLQMPDDRIELVCPEIENCPRNFGTKTARGIVAESLMALSHGMNSLSYFIVDPTDEPQSWYGETYYAPLAAAAPKLRRYAELSRGTRPAGLRLLGKVPPQLCALGLPMTAAPTWGDLTLIDANSARACTDQELENALLGGVVTDVSAARILKERELLASDEVGCVERKNARIQVLAEGAFGADWGLSSKRRRELAEAADMVSLGRLAAFAESPCQAVVTPRTTIDGALRTVAVVNASIDVAKPIVLHLRGLPEILTEATWTPLSGLLGLAERKLPIDRSGEDGEPRVTLPEMDAWAAGYLSF